VGVSLLNSDELLDRLRPYATVSIFGSQKEVDTWSATATLRIQSEGAAFEIKSGYGHPTANAALVELLKRVEAVVNKTADLKRLTNED
jgi:hypothetical protein